MTAYQRTLDTQNQILYKKVGSKYVPASDPYAYQGLREGWWLVKIAAGCTSIRQQVYPAKAELSAAIRDKEDKIAKVISDVTTARPKEGIPMTEQAQKDWKWFIDKHGSEFNMLFYPSISEASEKIIAALIND